MNALVHLLAEVHPLLREAARQKLKDLKTELNSPSVTASLKQLADQRPVFPELDVVSQDVVLIEAEASSWWLL